MCLSTKQGWLKFQGALGKQALSVVQLPGWALRIALPMKSKGRTMFFGVGSGPWTLDLT